MQTTLCLIREQANSETCATPWTTSGSLPTYGSIEARRETTRHSSHQCIRRGATGQLRKSRGCG